MFPGLYVKIKRKDPLSAWAETDLYKNWRFPVKGVKGDRKTQIKLSRIIPGREDREKN